MSNTSEYKNLSPSQVTDNIGDFTCEPIPFDGMTAPAIDTSSLPVVLKDIVEHTASAIQVPAELVFAGALGAMAAVVQDKAEVYIHDDYSEPLNIYILTALPPGERKSPALAKCKSPLIAWEQEQQQKISELKHAAESERASLEKVIESTRSQLINADNYDELREQMQEIMQMETDLPEVPQARRLLADDVTPEALSALMEENNESLAIIEAEGGLLETLAGRYSNGTSNIDLVLKAWGREPVKIDRRRGEPIMLERPTLTICLSAQPDVVKALAEKQGFIGRGFTARFVYFMPKSDIGYRNVDTGAIPEAVKNQYATKLINLLNIPNMKEGNIYKIRLSPDANQLRKNFARYVEINLRDGGELEHTREWAAKLPGTTIRIAGLLHCYEYGLPFDHDINAATMQTAIDIATILIDHAKIANALMGISEEMEAARHILNWITRPRNQPLTQFSGRDCFSDLKGKLHKMAKVNLGLAVLKERFYIIDASQNTGMAGRPTSTYKVNPAVFRGAK